MNFDRLSYLAVFGGLLATAIPAHAQPSENHDDEIVVPGERPISPREIRRQARKITADRSLWGQPLARFEEPVCPAVVGLPFDLASPLILRVRAVARTIGVETADASDCQPNVVIAFTEDGKADLAALAKRDVSMISGLSFWQRKRLLREEGPARAFAMVATVSNSGMRSTGQPPVVVTTMASRLMLSARRDIDLAVVLINADAADGKTVMQLADYAAMRTFARTKPPKGEVYYSTILQLFEDVDPLPQRLTVFDVSYLRATYSGTAEKPGNSKLKRISKGMDDASEDLP